MIKGDDEAAAAWLQNAAEACGFSRKRHLSLSELYTTRKFRCPNRGRQLYSSAGDASHPKFEDRYGSIGTWRRVASR